MLSRASSTAGAWEVSATLPSMPFGLGIWEILILAGVLVLLFGAKGAPAMARRLGTGVRELKESVAEMHPASLLDPRDEPSRPAPRRELEPPGQPAAPMRPATPAKPEARLDAENDREPPVA